MESFPRSRPLSLPSVCSPLLSLSFLYSSCSSCAGLLLPTLSKLMAASRPLHLLFPLQGSSSHRFLLALVPFCSVRLSVKAFPVYSFNAGSALPLLSTVPLTCSNLFRPFITTYNTDLVSGSFLLWEYNVHENRNLVDLDRCSISST